jgi:hypothetical protein
VKIVVQTLILRVSSPSMGIKLKMEKTRRKINQLDNQEKKVKIQKSLWEEFQIPIKNLHHTLI